jgi:arylsulfatase
MQADARGALVVQGDQFGGMGLLLDQGHALFLYNPTGRMQERVRLQSTMPLAPGAHDVTLSVEPKEGAAARSATFHLSVDGQRVASADVPSLYRVHGDAYIGRPGTGKLLSDEPMSELTAAQIQSVDITTHTTSR